MTVSELIEELKKHPGDMRVITTMCSDFRDLEAPVEIEVLHNPSNNHYLHFYRRQHYKEPLNAIKALHFAGN